VKRFIPLIALSIGLFVTGVVHAESDLIVIDIALQPESPVAGETVTIAATIRNGGVHDVDGAFHVRFAVDSMQVETPMVPFGLDAGHSETVSATWRAEEGTHTIVVEVDQPFDNIDEADETNNALVATLVIPMSPTLTTGHSALKVAVARFDDRSSSGFINVSEGIADALVERLANRGVRVLERSELEAVMQERSLNPFVTHDLASAGQSLGADLLIVGSVDRVAMQQSSLSLGLLSVSNASVEMGISAQLVNVHTTEIEKVVSAEGKEEGTTGFSIGKQEVIARSPLGADEVCLGGLRTTMRRYSIGETVHIGYRNPGKASWFTVEVNTMVGQFIKWLDWQYVAAGDCGKWLWDQRDMWNTQMSPGMYIAKLWDGVAYIATVSFQIKLGSGLTLPPLEEITVGTSQFADTIVGKATDGVLDQLVSELLRGVEEVAPRIATARGAPSREEFLPGPMEGQIARLFPDGRVVINLGASSGVSKGDFFQTLDTEDLVIDPTTGVILAYDIVEVKGEIVIVEVRDRVAYGVKTTDFVPLVGDVVRLVSS